MSKHVFISNSPTATMHCGENIGKMLSAGTVIALIGELGAGKTLFTRGLAKGLGVPERVVNSPTFVLVNEYSGRFPVFHVDLYRLNSVDEGLEIGLLDYMEKAKSGIIVIEWAEKIPSLLPQKYLEVRFEVLSARKRRIIISSQANDFKHLVTGMNKK